MTASVSTTKKNQPRLEWLSLMKGVAAIVMVIAHFVQNLSIYPGVVVDKFYIRATAWMPYTRIIPVFFCFASGISHRLWIASMENKLANADNAKDVIVKTSIRRAVFLYVFDHFGTCVCFQPSCVFDVDIMTFYAASMLILTTLWKVRTSNGWYLLLALFWVAVAPWARQVSRYNSFWTNDGALEPPLLEEHGEYYTSLDLIRNLFANGVFPLFPWMALPLTGYVYADAVLLPTMEETSRKHSHARSKCIVFGLGLCMIAGSFATMAITGMSWEDDFTMFPFTPVCQVALLGYVLVLFIVIPLVIQFLHINKTHAGISNILVFGNHSLSLWTMHHAAHLVPLKIIAGGELRETGLETDLSIKLAILFLAIFPSVITLMKRCGVPTAESLMRWLCDM